MAVGGFMKKLQHYMNTDKEELRSLVEGDVSFSVLYDILGGECEHIFTDGEEIIICHSNPPYPVWVWCGAKRKVINIDTVAKYIKEYFPPEKYDIVIDAELMLFLSETDKYFKPCKIKTVLYSYILDETNAIDKVCDGRMEMAEYGDLETLAHIRKAMAFEMEGFDFTLDKCREDVEGMIEDDRLFIWRNDDGEIVASANKGEVGKFGKVSGVYTLPQHRRRGYAINLVRGVTQLILDEGLIPALYTDGEYSASNECYKKIGYRQAGILVIINK